MYKLKRPKLIISAVAFASVVSVLLGSMAALGGLQALADRLVPPLKTPVAEAPPDSAMRGAVETPSLTDEEIARAEQILAADPRTSTLLRGKSYTIKDVGPWTDAGHEKIGAMINMTLAELIPVDGVWPIVEYPGDSGAPYQETTMTVRGCEAPRGWKDFYALVDLTRDELVALGFAAPMDPSLELSSDKYCGDSPQ